MLIGDRNAVLIAVRVSAYGNEYQTKVTCPACGASDKYEFDLNSANVYKGENIDTLDVTSNSDGTFTTLLPKTGLSVQFRLLNGIDERNIMSGMKSDRKQNIHERGVTRQLKNFIVSVDGNSQPKVIDYVVSNIPSIDSRHLRMAYKLAAPNIDLTQVYLCDECGHSAEMEVPLTADFFWPDR